MALIEKYLWDFQLILVRSEIAIYLFDDDLNIDIDVCLLKGTKNEINIWVGKPKLGRQRTDQVNSHSVLISDLF